MNLDANQAIDRQSDRLSERKRHRIMTRKTGAEGMPATFLVLQNIMVLGLINLGCQILS
jgi:hypothetical protein